MQHWNRSDFQGSHAKFANIHYPISISFPFSPHPAEKNPTHPLLLLSSSLAASVIPSTPWMLPESHLIPKIKFPAEGITQLVTLDQNPVSIVALLALFFPLV